MKKIIFATLIALIVIVSAPTATAADASWTLRLNGGGLTSSGGTRGDAGPATFTATVGDSAVFSIGLEYRIAERFGIELSALHSNVEVGLETRLEDWSARDSVSLAVTPITLAFNIHLTPRANVDFYVAPSLSHVRYGDFVYAVDDLGIEERVDVDDDSLAFGLTLGVDVPFGSSGWSFGAQVGTIWTDADGDDWSEMNVVSIDPLLIQVGVGRRF